MPDAHARPPEPMRELFKTWKKKSLAEIEVAQDIIDPQNPSDGKISYRPDLPTVSDGLALPLPFEVTGLPGLIIYPALFSPAQQTTILDQLLHRHLANEAHLTNLHLHYHVTYPDPENNTATPSRRQSFFAAPKDTLMRPKDPSMHKPLTYHQVLDSKLRWTTLGAQYDWTNKVYPTAAAPAFPEELKSLLQEFFPSIDPQAAIVNFYSPGDTLSVHRDVSEQCDKSLVSVSIGCDAIFIVGSSDENEDGGENGGGDEHGRCSNNDNTNDHTATIRLRSGDAVLMSGAARYAWHAVPKILPDTCPTWLRHWPAIPSTAGDTDLDGEILGQGLDHWRDWMAGKRINLNVRQVTETETTP